MRDNSYDEDEVCIANFDFISGGKRYHISQSFQTDKTLKGIIPLKPIPESEKQKSLVYTFHESGAFQNQTVSMEFNFDKNIPSFLTFNGVNTTGTYCGDNGVVYINN